jgi:hypothetical protein
MIEGIKSLLFGIDFICHCQLHLTQYFTLVAYIYQDISGTQLQSIFDSDNFEEITFITESFHFSVRSQNLIFMRTELTSQQI